MAQQSMFGGPKKKAKKAKKRAPKRGVVVVDVTAYRRKVDRDKIKRTKLGRFAVK